MSDHELSEPRRVTIDGVEYVPATSVKGVAEMLKALALQYHTPESLAQFGMENLMVIVDEGDGRNGGETFQELAARLARL